MKISVTKDDILLGLRGSGKHCAIALAVRRHFPKSLVHVGGRIHIGSRVAKTPPTAQNFITHFDAGLPVEPFSFWLDTGDGAEPFVAPEVVAEPALT